MAYFCSSLLMVALLLLAVSQGYADTKQRYNPFERAIPTTTPDTNLSNSRALRSAIQTPPRLRGLLRADTGSMANLDGHLLEIGESALGYRLMAVNEHSADFLHRGQQIRLTVNAATNAKEVP